MDARENGILYYGPMVYRRDSTGVVSFESAPLPQGRITPGGSRYQLTDHLGSVVAVVSGTDGAVLESSRYGVYGSRTGGPLTVTATSTDGEPLRYRFSGKEDQSVDFSLPYTDFGARHYSPTLCRWLTPDPLSEKYYDVSPYAYCAGDPVNMVDPNGEDGVFIVFPDYIINVKGMHIPSIGHAGVLLIDNKTGDTRYYEYGRYDSSNKGVVRRRSIPNVVIGKDRRPTKKSLYRTLKSISNQVGHGGRIKAAYMEGLEYDAMKSYAEKRESDNNNPEREKYKLLSNNCSTFAAETLKKGETDNTSLPEKVNPIPNLAINDYEEKADIIEYPAPIDKTKKE